MAKSATFTDIETPTEFSGVLSSGGTLIANTTYYYAVMAVKNTSINVYQWSGNSLPSTTFSITTDTVNKSVAFTWNHPKGICHKYIIFRATQPLVHNSNGVLPIFGNPINYNITDTLFNIDGVCAFTDTGIANGGNAWYQNVAHGTLQLESTAPTTDIWSIVDLYNLDVANGWGVVLKLEDNVYRVNTYLKCYSGAIWTDTNKTIIFWDDIDATGGHFTFGNIDANLVTSKGCQLIFNATWLGGTTYETLNAYKTIFKRVLSNQLGIAFNNGVLQDVHIEAIRNFQPKSSNCLFVNVLYTDCDSAFGTGFGATFNNVILARGSRAFQTSGNTIIKVYNLTLLGSVIPVLLPGVNNQITLVNTNVTPETKFNTTYNTNGTWIKETFTYNLKVMNSIIGIEVAIVKIYDVFNNLIYDGITDANGDIPQQELIYRRQDYSNATPSVRTSTLYAPHKMVISKNGYETYTQFTNYTGCFAISHVVTLKSSIEVRPTLRGRAVMALNPELGSSSDLINI